MAEMKPVNEIIAQFNKAASTKSSCLSPSTPEECARKAREFAENERKNKQHARNTLASFRRPSFTLDQQHCLRNRHQDKRLRHDSPAFVHASSFDEAGIGGADYGSSVLFLSSEFEKKIIKDQNSTMSFCALIFVCDSISI